MIRFKYVVLLDFLIIKINVWKLPSTLSTATPSSSSLAPGRRGYRTYRRGTNTQRPAIFVLIAQVKLLTHAGRARETNAFVQYTLQIFYFFYRKATIERERNANTSKMLNYRGSERLKRFWNERLAMQQATSRTKTPPQNEIRIIDL